MSAGRLAVIMTTWRRLHRLPSTLSSLLPQTFQNFDLFIWNNNREPGMVEQVDTICQQYSDHLPITTIHSTENMLCRGRQILARRLALKYGYKYVVFLDDDLQIVPGLLERLWDEKQPTTIVSPTVWKASSPLIWPKLNAKPGEYGFYGESCGAIIDISLFAHDQYWSLWPQRFWIVDDMWMSTMAMALGWRIVKTSFALMYDQCATDENARSDNQQYKLVWREFAGLYCVSQPGRLGVTLYAGELP